MMRPGWQASPTRGAVLGCESIERGGPHPRYDGIHEAVPDEEQKRLLTARVGVVPLGVHLAAAPRSGGDSHESSAGAAIAAFGDSPADHVWIRPVIAGDNPEGRARGALSRLGPVIAMRSEFVCPGIQGSTPRPQSGIGEVGQGSPDLVGRSMGLYVESHSTMGARLSPD